MHVVQLILEGIGALVVLYFVAGLIYLIFFFGD